MECLGTNLPASEMDGMRVVSNGGRHTGVSPAGKSVAIDVPPGSDICVITEWEVRAETYAQFARNGVPWWPDRDWEVDVESFCFFKN